MGILFIDMTELNLFDLVVYGIMRKEVLCFVLIFYTNILRATMVYYVFIFWLKLKLKLTIEKNDLIQR